MPAVSPSRPPFRRLRRALLVLAGLVVCGVAGLYLLGRQTMPPVEVVAGPDPLTSDEGALAFSEGFEYEQRIGERSAFLLAGERFVRGRDESVSLEGVAVELTREDGGTYRIESRHALWRPDLKEAQLTEAVRLVGPRGLQLTSERLDLVDGGRRLISRGPVGLALGERFGGRAAGLRFETPTERLHLQGRVRLAGTTGEAEAERRLALEAGTMMLDRPTRTVRASNRVLLQSGGDRLAARWLEVVFDEDEREPVSALARGGVHGGFDAGDPSGSLGDEPTEAMADARGSAEDVVADASGDPEELPDEEATSSTDDPVAEATAASSTGGGRARVRFQAAVARLAFAGQPSRPAQLELDGEAGSPARLVLVGDDAATRVLTAPTVLASFGEDGHPTAAGASGGVVLRERGGPSGLREASGAEATVGFQPGGTVGRIELRGAVRVAHGDTEAHGERAQFDPGTGTGALFGSATAPATARGPRGVLFAPRIDVDQAASTVRATGGVRGELARGAAIGPDGSAAGASDEPVHIRAREASWADAGRSWRFAGEVQAVQGETLLFADELVGTEAGSAQARGGVRTVWREAATAELPEPPSTTVSAAQLAYRRQPGELLYEGEVMARQGERELAAARVRVELDEAGQARHLEATGDVRILDRASGRTISGSRADHDLVARRILVVGEPVLLREPGGTQVRGRRLIYDLAAGTARMLSEGEEP